MSSIIDDFKSDDFKKLFGNMLVMVLKVIGIEHVLPNNGNIQKVYEASGVLAGYIKGFAKVEKLDRHKLLAVLTYTILEHEPLVMINMEDSKYLTGAQYANELLALSIIYRILGDQLADEFGEKFISLSFPNTITDEASVEHSLANCFYLIRKSIISVFGSDLSVVVDKRLTFTVSNIFSLSHIIYWIEKYNRDVIMNSYVAGDSEPLQRRIVYDVPTQLKSNSDILF